MFLIQINIPSRWWYNMAKIVTRPIFGPSGHPIGQKFLLAQNFTFFGHLVTCPPPLFSPKMMKFKKQFFFYLRYVNSYYNQPLVLWCYSTRLQKIYKWWPRWCQKNTFFNKIFFTVDFGHFFVTNFFKKICDKKVTKLYRVATKKTTKSKRM